MSNREAAVDDEELFCEICQAVHSIRVGDLPESHAIELLNSEFPLVRSIASVLLAELGEWTYGLISRGLEDPDESVRLAAAFALGWEQGPYALRLLTTVATGDGPGREAAQGGLRMFGDLLVSEE